MINKFRLSLYFAVVASLVSGGSNIAAAVEPQSLNEIEITQSSTPQTEREYTGIVGKVDQIAQAITVRIDNLNNGSNGSGVIIARDGNTYYVATAKHVLCTSLDTPECNPTGEQQIVTSDGETHQLDYARVQAPQTWLDIAVLEFDSVNDYQVATLGKYRTENNQWMFVSGFPRNETQTSDTRYFTAGQTFEKEISIFIAKDKYSLDSNGQGLIYSNLSYGGMSGGPVLDTQGRVIGINTGAEFDYTIGEVNLGWSLGVAIQDFFGLVQKEDIRLATNLLQLETTPAVEITSVEEESIQQQLLTVTAPTEDSVTAWLNYANSLWRYRRLDQAVRAFEQAIELEPNTDIAYYGMGLTLWYQTKYSEAAIAFKRATEINPNPYYYWRWLGVSYDSLNQYERAIEAYNTAISKNAKDFILYYERGSMLQQLQQYESAINDYTQAANFNPNHPWIYNRRGTSYKQLQKYQEALADYSRAIELNPQFAEPHYNRGILYHERQKYQEALANYTQALTINPQYADAYNNRGNVYLDMQQYQEALANYTQALKINPQLVEAYYNRGNVYSDMQQYQEALADYTQALKINPQYADAYFNRGSVYTDMQQYQEALADYSRAIEINPQSADAYNNRGITYYFLRNFAQSKQDLEQAALLYQQQNNPQKYQQVQELLKLLETAQAQP